MENNTYSNELQHWGIKGMKWGVRRYQNADGSLTPAGQKRYLNEDGTLNRAGKRRFKKSIKEAESDEQRRNKALASTDAREIYKNRDVLSTAEINERLNRINTEQRLADVANSTKKSGMDRVDKALKVGRKINEVYEFTNTPVMKALKKKMGIDKVEEAVGLDKIYEQRNKLSTSKLQEALKRANTEKAIKKLLDEEAEVRKTESRKAEAQKQVDDYNKQWERNDNSKYNKTGDDIIDNKVATGKASKTPRLAIEQIDRAESDGKVYGEGTSKFTGWDKKVTVIDAEPGKDYWDISSSKNTPVSSSNSTELITVGQTYLLEDKS